MSDKPKPFQMKPEGSMQLTISPDGSVNAHTDGSLELTFEKIKSVGVENIVDIETHTITRVANSTSHFIKLFGGGEVVLAYNDKGQILDFNFKDVLITVSGGERIVIRRKS